MSEFATGVWLRMPIPSPRRATALFWPPLARTPLIRCPLRCLRRPCGSRAATALFWPPSARAPLIRCPIRCPSLRRPSQLARRDSAILGTFGQDAPGHGVRSGVRDCVDLAARVPRQRYFGHLRPSPSDFSFIDAIAGHRLCAHCLSLPGNTLNDQRCLEVAFSRNLN